ncbi:YlbE-like family protein [Bacillus alkalicellulosilyticus]|uniref:YlbE-like family protein n=1 Tax=Alkalihalobacterium alkalicellulosilyticum TaxID=1912214 RepID=UPI000996EB32|nr:YlbE-like family protein [Bacillus alkalicellulosilyticus]
MRQDVFMYVVNKPELRNFIRQHPHWYRRLGREPYSIKELEKQANHFYGKTFPQRVEKLQGNLNLAMMMLQMLQMNSSNPQGPPPQ